MTTTWMILFSAAITVVFTQGSIFKALREHGPKLWRDLTSCALCSGVWAGLVMRALFSSYPHAGDSLGIARYVAESLGIGAASGSAAVLFVAAWDWLAEKPGIHVASGATLMYATKPEIQLQSAKFAPDPSQTFPPEAPTDPTTENSDNRLTKKISTDRIHIEASRRSSPENDEK